MLVNKPYVLIGAVNYGTAHLISNWAASARFLLPNVDLVIVDNYLSEEERARCESIANELGITLIKSENCGYGASLNKIALHFTKKVKNKPSESDILLFGNIDIIFSKINVPYSPGGVAYLAKGIENRRLLNPFLNTIQRKFLPIHKVSVYLNSSFILMITTVIIKFLSLFYSKPWTSHGSLFCINSKGLNENAKIFNEESFLYSEELEFGSYLERNEIPLLWADIEYEHTAHVSTSKIIKNHQGFFKYWRPSFVNWLNGNPSTQPEKDIYLIYYLNKIKSDKKNLSLILIERSILNFKYSFIDIQRKLQSFLYDGNLGKSFLYAISSDGKTVGYIFLSEMNGYRHKNSKQKSYELSIEINYRYRQMGYASEALNEISNLHANLFAFVRCNNLISNNLFSKNACFLYKLRRHPAILGATYIEILK